MRFRLLVIIGKAVLRRAVKALMKCLPLGEALYDVAKDAQEEWNRLCEGEKRRQEMEELARMTASQALEQARRAAAEATQDPDEREALAGYLNQIPAQARRTLSRPDDMAGLTVPAGVLFDNPNALVPFLPVRRSPLLPNQEIGHAGRTWVLREPLGGGGFGEVWRAQTIAPEGGEVALKFCLDTSPAALASLRNEVEIFARLRGHHAGIVPLRVNCLDAPRPFLVYDYVPGGDLVRLIHCWRDRPPKKGLIPEAVRLTRHLAQTLGPAHALPDAVVHRDLKPSNILLRPGRQPRHYVPLLCDFGIGGVASTQALERSDLMSENESTTTSLRGAHSLLYASPQRRQWREGPDGERLPEPDADPADDVYALGVIFYQVLIGDTTVEPLSGTKSTLRARNVPDAVIAVLRACIATNVEDRLPNAGAVVAALDEAMPPTEPLK